MDTVFKIVGIALVTCVACLVVKPVRPDFAIFVSIVGGITIIMFMLTYLSSVFDVFNNIFKIIGIGYLTEFTASICNDTGNSSLGDKVLLGGKIIILVMALPIITSILDIVMQLLPR